MKKWYIDVSISVSIDIEHIFGSPIKAPLIDTVEQKSVFSFELRRKPTRKFSSNKEFDHETIPTSEQDFITSFHKSVLQSLAIDKPINAKQAGSA